MKMKNIKKISVGRAGAVTRLGNIKDSDFALMEYGGDYNIRNDLKAVRRRYIMTMSEILDQGATPVILSLPPVDVRRSIDGNTAYLWHEAINMELYKIAVENGFQFIDITTPMLASEKLGNYLDKDGISLSAEGHRLVEDIIRTELQTF